MRIDHSYPVTAATNAAGLANPSGSCSKVRAAARCASYAVDPEGNCFCPTPCATRAYGRRSRSGSRFVDELMAQRVTAGRVNPRVAGPLKERVAANQRDWMRLLTAAADEATRRGELPADTDVAVLVFELNALVIAANTAFILHEDPAVIARARPAVARVLSAATSA